MELHSDSFRPGGTIPVEHTADGDDVSPPLTWSGAPAGTHAFALIVHDPDAPRGDWVHWVLYDLAPDAHALSEGASDGGRRGKNDFGRLGWGGPSPPPGSPHHYVFELVALDAKLGLPEGATRDEVEHAMRGHELARAKLTGTYGRSRR